MAKEKKRQIKKKLFKFYRLLIVDNNYEEKFSTQLNRVNVLITLGIYSIIIMVLTYLLISFTPIKNYIPGYGEAIGDDDLRVKELYNKSEALEQDMIKYNAYVENLGKLLNGKINRQEMNENLKAMNDSLEIVDWNDSVFYASSKDSAFRAKMEREDRFNINRKTKVSKSTLLFAPIKGSISNGFSPADNHYAVDIACKLDDPIKSVEDGTVVFAEWTADSGFVIIVRHSTDMISVYKHNNALYKSMGDRVSMGEVIAASGNTGEVSTGPHLHFELWSGGVPVNPENFIKF